MSRHNVLDQIRGARTDQTVTALTQTYSTADATHAARTAAALTEGAGAIGGTSDGDLPSLTATAATLTDNSGGADTPDGTIAVIADGVLSTSDTYTDAAVLVTVDAIVDDCANAVEECADQINKLIADNVALRAAIRENSEMINATIVDQADTAQFVNTMADDLQTMQALG
jgi:hypothetical protein